MALVVTQLKLISPTGCGGRLLKETVDHLSNASKPPPVVETSKEKEALLV